VTVTPSGQKNSNSSREVAWRCQLWGTGARARFTPSNDFFQLTSEPHKVCNSQFCLVPYSLSLWQRGELLSTRGIQKAPNAVRKRQNLCRPGHCTEPLDDLMMLPLTLKLAGEGILFSFFSQSTLRCHSLSASVRSPLTSNSGDAMWPEQ